MNRLDQARRFDVNWPVGLALLALSPFLVYLPLVRESFAWHDDYYFWAWDRVSCQSHYLFNGLKYVWGRPIAAYLLCGIGQLVTDLESTRLARLVGIGQLAVLGVVIAWWLHRRCRLPAGVTCFIAASVLTLPAFQVQVAMINNSHQIIAGLFSALALIAWDRGLSDERRTARWAWSLLGGVLALLSLATYQAAGMLLWALWGAYLLTREGFEWAEARRRTIVIGLYSVFSYGAYALWMRLLRADHPELRHDIRLTQQLKLGWFLREPLNNAANLWNVFPHWAITLAVLVGLVVCVRAHLRRRPVSESSRGQRAVALIGLVFLSALPILVAARSDAFYRTLAPLSTLLLLLLSVSIAGLLEIRRPIAGVAFVAALFTIGSLAARRTVGAYYIDSAKQELQYLEQKLASSDLGAFSRIHIVRPKEGESLVTGRAPRYDEYARPATSYASDVPLLLASLRSRIEAMRNQPWRLDYLATEGAKNYQRFDDTTFEVGPWRITNGTEPVSGEKTLTLDVGASRERRAR